MQRQKNPLSCPCILIFNLHPLYSTGDKAQQSHSYIHAIMCLAEICRAGIAVHLGGDLIYAWQRMHYGYVLLGALKQVVVHYIAALATEVARLVGKALALYAGHVYYIGLSQGGLYVTCLGDVRALGLKVRGNLPWHLKLIGGGKYHFVAKLSHEVSQAVNGASILKVAQEGYGLTADVALFLADSVDVQQGLGGVLTGAVATIDKGMLGYLGRLYGRAGLGMAHYYSIDVAVYGAQGILPGLALGLGRSAGAPKIALPCVSVLEARLTNRPYEVACGLAHYLAIPGDSGAAQYGLNGLALQLPVVIGAELGTGVHLLPMESIFPVKVYDHKVCVCPGYHGAL